MLGAALGRVAAVLAAPRSTPAAPDTQTPGPASSCSSCTAFLAPARLRLVTSTRSPHLRRCAGQGDGVKETGSARCAVPLAPIVSVSQQH